MLKPPYWRPTEHPSEHPSEQPNVSPLCPWYLFERRAKDVAHLPANVVIRGAEIELTALLCLLHTWCTIVLNILQAYGLTVQTKSRYPLYHGLARTVQTLL